MCHSKSAALTEGTGDMGVALGLLEFLLTFLALHHLVRGGCFYRDILHDASQTVTERTLRIYIHPVFLLIAHGLILHIGKEFLVPLIRLRGPIYMLQRCIAGHTKAC